MVATRSIELGLAAALWTSSTVVAASPCDPWQPMPGTSSELRAAKVELERCAAQLQMRLDEVNRRLGVAPDVRMQGSEPTVPARRPDARPLTYAAPGTVPVQPSLPAAGSSYVLPNGRVCYVGPRGGTYTITSSGKKNYGGC